MTAFPDLRIAKGAPPTIIQPTSQQKAVRNYSRYYDYFPRREYDPAAADSKGKTRRVSAQSTALSVKGKAASSPRDSNAQGSSCAPDQQKQRQQRVPTVSSVKTCPQCAHLADKIRSGLPLHSLLAYTRCRCHRPDQTQYSSLGTGDGRSQGDNTVKLMVGREKPPSRCESRDQGRRTALFRRRSLASRRSAKEGGLGREVLPKMHDSVRLESASKNILVTSIVVAADSSLSAGSGVVGPGKLQKSSGALLQSSGDVSKSSASHLPRIPPEQRSHITLTTSRVLGTSPSHQRLSVISEPSRVLGRRAPKPFSVLTLIKHIDPHKQKLLRQLFVTLDCDDDGHLTFRDVCKGIEPLSVPETALTFLHKLYVVLSEMTYHGKREFLLLYSVAELLAQGRPALSIHLKKLTSVDRESITSVLVPLVEECHKRASGDGKVPFVQFQQSFVTKSGRRPVVSFPFETISLFEVLAFGLLF